MNHTTGKLWAAAIKHAASATDACQLQATDVTESLSNIASVVIFIHEIDINELEYDDSCARLEKVRDINREAYYEKNPEELLLNPEASTMKRVLNVSSETLIITCHLCRAAKESFSQVAH